MRKEVKKIISDLNNKRITILDIPDKYKKEQDIVTVERRLGLRTVGRRGYDVIKNRFFVEEKIHSDIPDHLFMSLGIYDDISWFDTFEEYSAYLDGDVYENACYYQYDPPNELTGIDHEKLFKKQSLVKKTIDDYTINPSEDEIAEYKAGETRKEKCMELLRLYRACTTPKEIQELNDNFKCSDLAREMYEVSKDQL